MNNGFLEKRSSKTVEARKKLESLQKKKGLRLRVAGSSTENIESEIKYQEDIRKTLPPVRNEEPYGFESDGGMFQPNAGMCGIFNGDDDVAFWAGGNLQGAIFTMMQPYNLHPKEGTRQANFVVTHQGILIANQAIIRGDIFANDGVFNGTVYANDGVFKGTVYASAGEFNGKITSNHEGDRLVIDPADRSMKMINAANQQVVKQDFFVNGNYSGGQIQVNLVDQATGANHCHAVIDGGKIVIYRGDVSFCRFDAYQSKIWIDADALPQGRDNAYAKEVYMDGETMKIRRE